MSDPPASITLDDVAAAAGVSTATVSRFFNSPEVVAKRTAERIREAVERLGYIPNLLAGGLASSRSRLVAVIIPQLSGSIFVDTIEAMVCELSASGYVSLLGMTELPHERTRELVHAALARRVEAIVITSTLDEPTRAMLRRSGTTVIEIWDLPEDPVDVAIGFSHPAIGRELAGFVRERGYRRPHVVSAMGPRAGARRVGFLADWTAAGLPAPSQTLIGIPSRYVDARAAFAEIRRLEPVPDVVLCGSDLVAQGIVVEAGKAGLSIPGDLAVIGFGNTQLAQDMSPAITSVEIDGARIAREAVAVLRRRAEGQPIEERRIDVGFRIVARESA